MKTILLLVGFILLFTAEVLRIYFIMPFPGSQTSSSVSFAYWLTNNIFWLRFIGFILLMIPLRNIFLSGSNRSRLLAVTFLILYSIVFYFFNFKFQADKMFSAPRNKILSGANNNKVDLNKLVIGISINGDQKCYPIEIIGFHHQVMDTVGSMPVMVTYCTVCRTGRIFSPLVNNKMEKFRLVGMDHFNAMFEDETTKSWWQQATGKCIAGPLNGSMLKELPSVQMSLQNWLLKYPNTQILQPDTVFKKQYKDLAGYDKGTIKSGLEKRDSASWKSKSWVVGVTENFNSKAYDWNELVKKQMIQDTLSTLPIMLTLEGDSVSFHVFSRISKIGVLKFSKIENQRMLIDDNTHSIWTFDGFCKEGSLKGTQLDIVQSYQEFWHSWLNFHPNTSRYNL